jgi:hypothetical protein
MKALLSAAALSAICDVAFAAQSGCKDQIEVTGACNIVVGSLNVTGDNGPVLWTNRGTKSFAIRGDKNMPSELHDVFNRDLTATVSGNFEICPLPGKSRFGEDVACIETVTDLSVRPSPRPSRTLQPRRTL